MFMTKFYYKFKRWDEIEIFWTDLFTSNSHHGKEGQNKPVYN